MLEIGALDPITSACGAYLRLQMPQLCRVRPALTVQLLLQRSRPRGGGSVGNAAARRAGITGHAGRRRTGRCCCWRCLLESRTLNSQLQPLALDEHLELHVLDLDFFAGLLLRALGTG